MIRTFYFIAFLLSIHIQIGVSLFMKFSIFRQCFNKITYVIAISKRATDISQTQPNRYYKANLQEMVKLRFGPFGTFGSSFQFKQIIHTSHRISNHRRRKNRPFQIEWIHSRLQINHSHFGRNVSIQFGTPPFSNGTLYRCWITKSKCNCSTNVVDIRFRFEHWISQFESRETLVSQFSGLNLMSAIYPKPNKPFK